MEGDLIQHHWFLVGRGGDSRDVTAQRKDREACRPRRGLRGARPAYAWILDVQPPELLKPPSLVHPIFSHSFSCPVSCVPHLPTITDTAKQKEKKMVKLHSKISNLLLLVSLSYQVSVHNLETP